MRKTVMDSTSQRKPLCHHLDQASCISVVPIFNHLDEDQMAEIMHVAKPKTYRKGEIVYREHDTSDSLYIVSKGSIRIYRLSASGKEQLIRILEPGDFTGELALFRKSNQEAYAEAMVETNVCMVNGTDLQAFLIKYPTIALKILAEFSNRLEASEKQVARLATESVDRRLILYLQECIGGHNGQKILDLEMSRKDLASYLGTTPETISRKFAEFEDEGWIRQLSGRKIQILNDKWHIK